MRFVRGPRRVLMQPHIAQSRRLVDTRRSPPSTSHFAARFDIGYWRSDSVPGVVGHTERLIHIRPFLLPGTLVEIHFSLRWRAGWQSRWRYRWLTNVSQDALDDCWLLGVSQDNQRARGRWLGTLNFTGW